MPSGIDYTALEAAVKATLQTVSGIGAIHTDEGTEPNWSTAPQPGQSHTEVNYEAEESIPMAAGGEIDQVLTVRVDYWMVRGDNKATFFGRLDDIIAALLNEQTLGGVTHNFPVGQNEAPVRVRRVSHSETYSSERFTAVCRHAEIEVRYTLSWAHSP